MLENQNIIVLDCEVLRSPEDCRHCGLPIGEWETAIAGKNRAPSCSSEEGHATIGWNNKPALGLSIGCYFDCQPQRVVWFDEQSLQYTIEVLLETHPLMVSFNGISFDFPLMRGLLHRQAETLPAGPALLLEALGDHFKALATRSYDLLAELWKVAPADKFSRGLNSLDSLATANGLGAKTGHGAQAPRDWAAGRYAEVMNYCQNDVYLTKSLFEMVLRGQLIHRSDGSALALPLPTWGYMSPVTLDSVAGEDA